MDNVVARLMRYAKVWSESDYHANRGTTPSTDRQFDMARLLVEELHGLGIDNAFMDDTWYGRGQCVCGRYLLCVCLSACHPRL